VATLSFGFGTAGLSFAAGVVATALAFGLVLLVLAYVIGPVSGCHINPAVTIGVWLTGRISLREAAGYWLAQFVGGILGALLLWGTFNCSPLYSTSRTGLGTDGWGSASHVHISAGGAFLVEVVLTTLFVFAVLQATSRAANATAAGVVVGFALTVVHLVGIPLTGGDPGLGRPPRPIRGLIRTSGLSFGQTGIDGNRTGKWNRRSVRPGGHRSDLGAPVVRGWRPAPVLVSNRRVRDQKATQAPEMAQHPGEYAFESL
jgi:hypothetical protein